MASCYCTLVTSSTADSLEEMVLSCIVTLHCLECYTHRYHTVSFWYHTVSFWYHTVSFWYHTVSFWYHTACLSPAVQWPFSRYVVRDSADRGLELAEVLSTHLPIIMGHVQPLECLLRIPSTISGRQQSCACHMTRLSLHIHWSVLSVAYRLAPLVGESTGPCTPASHCPIHWTQDGGCF